MGKIDYFRLMLFVSCALLGMAFLSMVLFLIVGDNGLLPIGIMIFIVIAAITGLAAWILSFIEIVRSKKDNGTKLKWVAINLIIGFVVGVFGLFAYYWYGRKELGVVSS